LINNFCTIFQPLPDEKKEISTYARKIIEKMEKNQIKTIEDEFAVFMLNHASINYQKYCLMCVDKNCKNKSGGKH
jgi:hypothetical protein